MTAIKRGFEDAAVGLPPMERCIEYRNGYAIAKALQETQHLFKKPMKTFEAKERGRYLSMTVDGRDISIHDSQYLEKGGRMTYPEAAFVMLVVASPDTREDR